MSDIAADEDGKMQEKDELDMSEYDGSAHDENKMKHYSGIGELVEFDLLEPSVEVSQIEPAAGGSDEIDDFFEGLDLMDTAYSGALPISAALESMSQSGEHTSDLVEAEIASDNAYEKLAQSDSAVTHAVETVDQCTLLRTIVQSVHAALLQATAIPTTVNDIISELPATLSAETALQLQGQLLAMISSLATRKIQSDSGTVKSACGRAVTSDGLKVHSNVVTTEWLEDTEVVPAPPFGLESPVITHMLRTWTSDEHKV